MPLAWRIEKARRAESAFSGEGARRYGGRWNSRGQRVVYLSQHRSLAALEVMVNSRPLSAVTDYVIIAAEWDDAIMTSLSESDLPPDWQISPPGPATAAVGDQWLRGLRSAVLSVPSAALPAERNFLVNPAHSDFRRIRIGEPESFRFDPRLLQR